MTIWVYESQPCDTCVGGRVCVRACPAVGVGGNTAGSGVGRLDSFLEGVSYPDSAHLADLSIQFSRAAGLGMLSTYCGIYTNCRGLAIKKC